MTRRARPGAGQLAFTIPSPVTELIEAELHLIEFALDDAAAWREHLDDTEAADAYRDLAARIETAGDDQ